MERFVATLAAAGLRRCPSPWLWALRAGLWVPRDEALGRLGEALVARELDLRGWRVIGRRVRTPLAELDLLAERGDTLRVVEVKTARRHPAGARFGGPLERVSERQLRRLERGARAARRRLGHARLRLTLAGCVLEPQAPAGRRSPPGAPGAARPNRTPARRAWLVRLATPWPTGAAGPDLRLLDRALAPGSEREPPPGFTSGPPSADG